MSATKYQDPRISTGTYSSVLEAMERRKDDLQHWLRNESGHPIDDQRHLDADSIEQTYWHYGYLVAIKDVLALLGNTSTSVN